MDFTKTIIPLALMAISFLKIRCSTICVKPAKDIS